MSKMTEKEFNQQIVKWGEAGLLDGRHNEAIEIAVDFELIEHIDDTYIKYNYGEYHSCGLMFRLRPLSKMNGMQLL